MKKLITICLLVVTTFTVKAQDMSFEETVKYINEKLACCNTWSLVDTIKVKRDGTIIWEEHSKYKQTINLLDLYEDGPSSGGNVIESKFGISRLSAFGIINFEISKSADIRFGEFKVEADQKRVYNALLHLRSLCTKAKDPFDK